MDTGVQTTKKPQSTESSRPQPPELSRPKNLEVHIDNPADKSVKHTSLSDKRKNNAAKAKAQRVTNQDVQFNSNNKSVADLTYQSTQVPATPLCLKYSLQCNTFIILTRIIVIFIHTHLCQYFHHR